MHRRMYGRYCYKKLIICIYTYIINSNIVINSNILINSNKMYNPDEDIVDKHINNNLDYIIDNLDTDELLNNDIEDYNKQNKINNNIKIREDENEEYVKLLINTYMAHYNKSCNSKETWISNIVDDNTPNLQMEIIYSLKLEFENIRDKLGLLNNIECLDYIFEKEKYIDIGFKSNYCLDMIGIKLYTPSLLMALNYIIINNITEWIIFDLSDKRFSI